MRAVVERLAAHEGGRLARNADRQQHSAVERAMAHRMVAIVRQPDRVVERDMHAVRLAMGPGEDAFAPGAQQIAVVVEYRNRMLAAIEGVDVILAVDPDSGAIAEHDLVRELRPALLDLERPLAAAERHGHPVSPDLDRGIFERLAGGQQVGSAGEVFWIVEGAVGLRAGLMPRVWRARPSTSRGAIWRDARPGDRRWGRADSTRIGATRPGCRPGVSPGTVRLVKLICHVSAHPPPKG